MAEFSLISWNVNGIRAMSKKVIYQSMKFNTWLNKLSPDALCIQETKAHPDQLTAKLLSPQGYKSYWNSAERKGYSGVATYSKTKPLRVNYEISGDKFDREGRVIETEYPEFVLFNVYFPNGKLNEERLKYKLEFYDYFLEHIEKVRAEGKSIIVCGDVNTAHTAIDLTHPKTNEGVSGFLPVERKWIDKLISLSYVDTFRCINKEPEHYTWWSVRNIVKGITARERNVGWRIDYFFVSEDLRKNIS
ncbi:MAG: exodeoxyribonuclease III, partial [Candidatus Heimdallarchaeota archaeon]|nr:exodeoxyribonuclease III [Candidatus Heimdallarchaeota archaeon]MCK4877602.1 exodeoxyribonuclease III [Candidatus Heimdallarchaeota archaeon]